MPLGVDTGVLEDLCELAWMVLRIGPQNSVCPEGDAVAQPFDDRPTVTVASALRIGFRRPDEPTEQTGDGIRGR